MRIALPSKLNHIQLLRLLSAVILPFNLLLAQTPASLKSHLDIPPFVQMPERFPRYPLKTERMIYKKEDVARAQKNIEKYPAARILRDSIVKEANRWLDWNDADLNELLADARVPRAFDLNPKGSPVHGDAVFKKGGFYPWIVDPRHPFQVRSPIDGQLFPTNDYAAYYKSGFKEKKNWTSEYVDDGWGWVAPDGERYWFVAYANHWLYKSYIEPGVANLGRAYLLTGDRRYAHKAAVMLHRLAEVYPSMDHANQSRYGLMEKAKGHIYNGKIVNLIWETSLIQNAAEAYDAIWETIDDDGELQKFFSKNGKSIRSFIEANLLEDALDAYMQRKIQGNYGMHQTALLYILLARQNMDTEKYLRMMVDEPGESRVQTGIRYALYNMIFRDGMPLESPFYNILTVDKMAVMGEMLYKGGLDLFKEKRFKMLFDSPLDLVAAGAYTPDIGDSGNALGGVVGIQPNVYQIAYERFQSPAYLTWLANKQKTGPNTFSSFESLFRTILPATAPLPNHRAVQVQKPRLFAGYGLGILNNPKDVTALSLNYGFKGTHFHWDFLNFELFANGKKMMPDLGYPDAMNEYVKEIYTWSTNTIAHNTVVVDQQRQKNNLPGILHDFSNGSFARSMDASAPVYTQTSQYRRNLIMVDVDDKQSYIVDFFHVTGGSQHDYSLHGPPGDATFKGGKWSEKRAGTLAGTNIEIGQIFDNKVLGAKDYAGGFGSYEGSGYQYLFNVQQFQKGKSTIEYAHQMDTTARLRIHLIPYENQEVFAADAFDKPRAKNFLLKYIVARRRTTDSMPLKSTFVSIMEPYSKKPFVLSGKILPLQKGKGVVVEVQREGVTDIVLNDSLNSVKFLAAYKIETDANHAVVTFDARGQLKRAFYSDGTFLRCNGKYFATRPVEGTVTETDTKQSLIMVRLTGKLNEPQQTGTVIHFSNPYGNNVHPVESANLSGNMLTVKVKDDLLVGKIPVRNAQHADVSTDIDMPFAPLYKGTTMLNADFSRIGTVARVTHNIITLSETPSNGVIKESDVWLSSVGEGDRVKINTCFSWISPENK